MIFDPKLISQQLLADGEAWADANAIADLLDESKKSLRSQIAMSVLKEAGSVNKAEMISEASPEYAEHIVKMVEARKNANKARVRYDTDKAYVELLRSQESTKRAELTLR